MVKHRMAWAASVFLLLLSCGAAAHAQTYNLDLYQGWFSNTPAASAVYTLTDDNSGSQYMARGTAAADYSGVKLTGRWAALKFSSFKFWYAFVGDNAGGVWLSGYEWNNQVFGRAYAYGTAPPPTGRAWFYGTVVQPTATVALTARRL